MVVFVGDGGGGSEGLKVCSVGGGLWCACRGHVVILGGKAAGLTKAAWIGRGWCLVESRGAREEVSVEV